MKKVLVLLKTKIASSVKGIVAITACVLFSTSVFAQPDLPNFIAENLNPSLSGLILVLSFIAPKVSFLKGINKVWLTAAVILVLSGVYSLQFGVPIKEIWGSILVAIFTYLGIGKPLVETPILKQE